MASDVSWVRGNSKVHRGWILAVSKQVRGVASALCKRNSSPVYRVWCLTAVSTTHFAFTPDYIHNWKRLSGSASLGL